MKRPTLKPLALAIGLALVGPASAVTLDFGGSNVYMKFLDGDRRVVSQGSGDTSSGSDNGQWTEFELRIKAAISPQVEAGVRLQSRSVTAYWTNFGFANNEGFTDTDAHPTQSKYIKLFYGGEVLHQLEELEHRHPRIETPAEKAKERTPTE